MIFNKIYTTEIRGIELHTKTHTHTRLYLKGVTMNTQNVFAMPGIEDVMIHLTVESDDKKTKNLCPYKGTDTFASQDRKIQSYKPATECRTTVFLG